MEAPESPLLPYHCLIDDPICILTQSLSQTLHPGPGFWHLLNVIMCSYSWCGIFALELMGPLGPFLSSRAIGFTACRAEIPAPTFKDAAAPSDGHGNLGRTPCLAMTYRPSPGVLLWGMLFYSTFV